jgi:hypothetical protein
MPNWVRGGLSAGAILLAMPTEARASSCGTHPCAASVVPNVCITGASRMSGGITEADARPPSQNPCGINYADCASNVALDLVLSIDTTNADPSDTLQVWAGPGISGGSVPCVASSARGTDRSSDAGSSSQVCWPLAPLNLNPSTTTQVTVHAQDIAAHLDATSLPSTYTPANDVVASCQRSQTSPGPISLGIYVLLVKSDGTVDGVPGVYGFDADVLGPNPPSSVTAVMNDGFVQLSWTASSDTSIAGYNVYCQNFGKDASVQSMGTPVDANLVEAGILSNMCGDTLFSQADVFTVVTSGSTSPPTTDSDIPSDSGIQVAAVTPAGISDVPASLLCASPTEDLDGAMTAGVTATSASVNLTNYDYYVFAVAAVDESGNVGPIASPLVCGTPGPIADFWYNYTNEGGLAGGGYCALEAVGTPGGGLVMGLGVTMAGAGLLRRRRRRS